MWRQMLSRVVFPKHINHFCYKQTVQKINNRKRVLFNSAFLMSTAHVLIDHISGDTGNSDETANEPPVTEIEDLQLAADIEATYAESGEALSNLISTLHACIQEICEQYQHCIAKQIEITISGMDMGPIGPHWDEITKYRVIADDLIAEFVKYKTLVATIGSIVKNERFKNADKNLSKSDINRVTEAFQRLVDMIEAKSKENLTWDHKLTDIHMKSILVTDDDDCVN